MIIEGADADDKDDDTNTAKKDQKQQEQAAPDPTSKDGKQKYRTQANIKGKAQLSDYEIEDLKARYKRGEYQLTIESIQPHGGPTSGQTRVLVRMDNLAPFVDTYPKPRCKFGSNSHIVDALYVKCVKKDGGYYADDNAEKDGICVQCEASPPNDEAEIITFTVSLTGNFDDASSSNPYRYYKDGVITELYPRSAPMNGDTVFMVTGENFFDSGDDFRCNFGSVSTKAHLKSSTSLWCRAPVTDVVGRAMPFSVTMNGQQNTR